MSSENTGPHTDLDVDQAAFARGAGTTLLARMGAAIELFSQPLYTWLFGLGTYGVYTVLWASISFISTLFELAMTTALQRFVPQAADEDARASVLKFALLVTVIPSTIAAIGIMAASPWLAGFINAEPEDAESLALAIAIFALSLPLWTFIEVATAAMRARAAFGPEIRLRIFYEQVIRLGLAVAVFAAGFQSLGLVLAHTGSLVITAGLALRLLGQYYDLGRVRRAALPPDLRRTMLGFGLAVLPANGIRRAFVDLPPILLNLLIPGAGGAAAAGLFGIARKIASVIQIIWVSFAYVMAPLASSSSKAGLAAVTPLYRFASRLATVAVLPLAAALIILGDDILRLFAPEARAAYPLIVILGLGRTLEVLAGPSVAIVEVVGHHFLPLANSLAGLAIWIVLAFVLVPQMGAVGMAYSVAVGLVAIAWLGLAELSLVYGLIPYTAASLRALLVGCGLALLLYVVHRELLGLGDWPATLATLLLWPATAWLALRFGLREVDRTRLGGFSTALRLT